jgi:hypothetical protein
MKLRMDGVRGHEIDGGWKWRGLIWNAWMCHRWGMIGIGDMTTHIKII